MEKYSRVEKPKQQLPINQNEIRITTQGLIPNYLSYAFTLLLERHMKEIVLNAMGQAISKAVAIGEIIKRRVPYLHQDVAISSVNITDLWEPKEEGLVQMETSRRVSMIAITLSTKELHKDSPGYQAPPQYKQPQQHNLYHHNQHQQSQPRQGRGKYNAIYDSYGGGRGRGGRGTGRAQSWGYGGYWTYQDNGGYQNWRRGGGQGSSYGGYGTYHDNGGSKNWGRGGQRRGWGYSDGGYQGGRGGGGGGRGYDHGFSGRGRMGGRSRGGVY